MQFDPLSRYAAPAGGSAELWRTAAGLCLTAAAGLAIYQALLVLMTLVLGADTSRMLIDEATFFTDKPRGVLIGLASQAVFAGGLVLAVRALHGRDAGTLLGATAQQTLATAIRVAMPVIALLAGIAWLLPPEIGYTRNVSMDLGPWVALLPLSLVAVLIQAGTEELIFRGYLLQQFAARFPKLPLWSVLPAGLFALMHWSPEIAGVNALAYAAWACAFGLAAADLTARTGQLGPAIGFHLAINVVAILGTALAGQGGALALWHLPTEPDDPALGAMFLAESVTLLCAWLMARIALRV